MDILKRTGTKAAVVVIGILMLVLIRTGVDQIQWYDVASSKMDSGDTKGAIMHFDSVLNSHIPFSPVEEKARRHLFSLAAAFEDRKEYELSLLCYETLRSSQYLTRSFYLPFSKDIPYLNKKIASLKTRLLAEEGFISVNDTSYEYRHQIEILDRSFEPSIPFSLITVISFLAYIGFVMRWTLNQKKVNLFAGLLFFVLWLVALYAA